MVFPYINIITRDLGVLNMIDLPTDKYPEYWPTPGVVSQIPELVTYSSFELVAACLKTVRPWRSKVLNCLLSGAIPPKALTDPMRPRRAVEIDEIDEKRILMRL
jgi:hypothetical protein